MIISVDDNRKFNGMLSDIREAISPSDNSKTFRNTIKQLDPNFPLNKDGSKKSMRDVTEDEFKKHLSFVKTMCLRQGVRLEYFTEIDVVAAEEAQFSVAVSETYEEQDELIIVGITCSNCGCETIRGLSEKRYKEAKDIEAGTKTEDMDPLTNSFLCANCISRKPYRCVDKNI